MPEINYNNPEFEGTLNDTYDGTSSDITDGFIFDYSYQSSGSSFAYTGTCAAKICLTTFAPQGFLLLLDITGTYSGLSKYIGPSSIGAQLDTASGVFTIPYNINLLLQRTNFTLQKISILSYRKRFLRFDLANLEIHESDWTQTYTLRPNLTVYKYDCNGIVLPIKNCFSLLSDEWTYYNIDTYFQDISSINEFPIYKYIITDNININHLIYEKTTSTSIVGPTGSRGRALLKSRGSHFLFNNNNKLQNRDFSYIEASTTKGNSNTQNYNKLGTSSNNKPTQAFLNQEEFNQIMQNKVSYNNAVVSLLMSDYMYFNNDKTGAKYYTDLGDNNKGPTLSNPYILYNNMTELIDSVSSTNLKENNGPSQLFGVDNYTLYCAKNIYYIPADGKVCMLKRAADSSALQFDSLTPSNYGGINKSDDNLNYVSVTAGLYSYVSKWILNESFSNVVTNYFINQNNSRETTNLNSIGHSITDEVSYSASVTSYKTEIHDYANSANSNMRYSGTTSKITINYTIWMPTFLNFHLDSMSASYSPSNDTYAVINDSLIKMTSDIIKQMNSSGNISRIYESLEFKIANMNGFIIKSGRSIKDQKKADLSTINLANGTYNYMLGDQKATGTQFGAGAYMYHGLDASNNNPNSYCIIAYNPNL